MSAPDGWHVYNEGWSIGSSGNDGVVLRDEEYASDARITLEYDNAKHRVAITCGIYGEMVHTRYFGARPEAERAFDEMKPALVDLVASDRQPDDTFAFTQFMERFA